MLVDSKIKIGVSNKTIMMQGMSDHYYHYFTLDDNKTTIKSQNTSIAIYLIYELMVILREFLVKLRICAVDLHFCTTAALKSTGSMIFLQLGQWKQKSCVI